MRRVTVLLLCLVLLFAMTACTTTPQHTERTTRTTLDETIDYIDQHTTVTENPDGTTTYTLTSDTETPAIPTKVLSTGKRTTTTTKNRASTTNDGHSTAVVTEKTTTTQKPAPIPTLPSTTTTTAAVTKPNETTAPTTTAKSFRYEYTTNQKHTWLALEDRYLYSLLDDEWKGYYRQIDEAVRNLEETVSIATDLSADRRYLIYQVYKFDNPELIYLADMVTIISHGSGLYELGFCYSVGRANGESCGYGKGELTEGLRQKILNKQACFDDAVNAIISTIPVNAPDAVKERIIYDKLLLSSAYNLPAAMGNQDAVGGVWNGLANDNWTAYGVMVNHTGVCESYSEAFQTLCNAVGINCTGIVGTAGGGHKWNAVKLDGEWYMCDVTFDDPIGGDANEAYHYYFNLTSARMKELGHDWSANNWEEFFRFLTVPNCTGTKYSWNNFVMLYGE